MNKSNLISRSFQQTFEKLGRVCIGINSQIGAKLFHPLCIICRLDRELKELERKNSVPCRWNPSDKDYQELEHAYCLEKRNFFDRRLWAFSVRRKFLIQLKSKYAGVLCS